MQNVHTITQDKILVLFSFNISHSNQIGSFV